MNKKVLSVCFLSLGILMQNLLGAPFDQIKVSSQDFIIPTYTFRNGQQITDLKVHYVTLGVPKKNELGNISNAILLLHWTGGSSADLLTESFFAELYASGKPLDAERYFLILPDSIGHGQSSKPSDGLKAEFPHYGYHDMVDIQHLLVTKELNLSHLKMVLGTSMGGMHTWLWTQTYPDFMDGAMPIVSLPKHVEGRNLLWREMIVQAITNDPEWKNGDYNQQPYSLIATWPFARMLLDGVPHLEKIIPHTEEALNFINEATNKARKIDANNLVYALDASRDYAPEDNLAAIRAKVYALDFSDDQLNPERLDVLQTLIKQVKNGQAIIQPATPDSFGHLSMAHPALWAHHVARFMQVVNKN